MSIRTIAFVDDAHTFGGAQVALFNMIKELSQNDRRKIILAVSNRNKKYFEDINNIKIYVLPSCRPLNLFLAFKKIIVLTKIIIFGNHKIDRWIINLSGIEFGLVPAIYLKLAGFKVFGWLHNPEKYNTMSENCRGVKLIINKLRDKISDIFIFRIYYKFFVPSESSKKIVLSRVRYDINISVIKNIVNLNQINNVDASAKLRRGLGGFKLVIAVIGRVEFSTKGQDRALDIASILKSKGYDPLFIFVGNGVNEEELKAGFMRRGLFESFKIFTWQENPVMWIDVADIVLIPSRFESFSLVAVEAMQRKKRIVASNLDSLKEVIPDICIVKNNSSLCFSSKIEEILSIDLDKLLIEYKNFIDNMAPTLILKKFEQEIFIC